MTPKRLARRAANLELAKAAGQPLPAKEDALQASKQAKIEGARTLRKKRAAKRRILGRKKLQSVRLAKNTLWEIVAECVKIRDRRMGGNCITCLQRPIEVACHIIPKSDSLNTAFDLDNIYGGCSHCNRLELRYRSRWARIIFPQIFGIEKMAELTRRSKILVKWGRTEFAEKIAQAREMLERMKGGQ